MTEQRMHVALAGDYLSRRKAADVLSRNFPGLQLHQDLFSWEFLSQRHADEEIEARYLERFDVLILTGQRVGTRTVSQTVAERLTAVARAGSGCDNIDLDTCTNADIVVFNSPHGLKHSVALGALTLLLCVGRNVLTLDRLVRQGRWNERFGYACADYLNHTLGVIGAGNIGQELIRLLAPFEMNVLAYDPPLAQKATTATGAELVSLPRLMSESDFVCVTCSLTPETAGLIDAEMLALMKPTAFLVNVARGAVVDQAALTQALQERRIAGAALDVFVEEPLPADDPLTKLDNVVLSPHRASSSQDMGRLTGRDLVAGLLALAHGEVPDNVVNPQVLNRPAFQAKLARWAQRS